MSIFDIGYICFREVLGVIENTYIFTGFWFYKFLATQSRELQPRPLGLLVLSRRRTTDSWVI